MKPVTVIETGKTIIENLGPHFDKCVGKYYFYKTITGYDNKTYLVVLYMLEMFK